MIDMDAFTNYLREQDLLIVSRQEYENRIDLESIRRKKYQKTLLKKSALTLKEIIDAELLPYGSKNGIKNLLVQGMIKEGELFTGKSGKQMLPTNVVKRIMQLKNIEL